MLIYVFEQCLFCEAGQNILGKTKGENFKLKQKDKVSAHEAVTTFDQAFVKFEYQ